MPQLTSSVPVTAPTIEWRPAAHRTENHHFDRRHDTDEGRRHEADLQREHRAAYRRDGRGKAEHEDLEVRDVVAGETDAILLVADRDQNPAELARQDEAPEQHGGEQQRAADEVEHVLGVIRPDVPAEQGAQVGDAVDAAGIGLAVR